MGYANMTTGIGWSIGSIVAGELYQTGGDKVVLAHGVTSGKTSLTNMIAAYDALPAATQRKIDGLVAPHYTGPGILGDHMSEV